MLRRSVLAVHAAALMLDADARPADSALRALRNGLPQTAEGRAIPEIKLLGAHREELTDIFGDGGIRRRFDCSGLAVRCRH